MKKPEDFIGCKVTYDSMGQYIWGEDKGGGLAVLFQSGAILLYFDYFRCKNKM